MKGQGKKVVSWLQLHKKGGLLSIIALALMMATLAFREPMEVYATLDPGLDYGNAQIDRATVPGQTILKYNTTGNSTFKAPTGVTSVRILVVGGGGGGGAGELNNAGDGGGGGGAGEFVHQTTTPVTPGQTVTVTVGGGGAGSTTKQNDGGTTAQNGANGNNSAFGSITARGGGGGGGNDQSGLNGGSGGGAGGKCSNTNRTAGSSTAVTPGVGNAGGSNMGSGCGPRGAAGGGGAGAVGTNASGSNGAAGGAGIQNDIAGSNVFYAAGGGGGASGSGGGASGGSSIGGAGGNASGGSGSAGAINTGSGGGGGGSSTSTSGGNGGNGGSGTVIVRFATQTYPDPAGVSGVKMWYKADSAGNSNSQWNDASGFGHNLTQTTASKQPVLEQGAINFNPAYRFDGADDVFRMNSHGIGGNEPMSAFFGATATRVDGGYRYFNEFGDDTPSISMNNGRPDLYVRGTSPIQQTYPTQEALVPHIYSFVSPNANNQSRIIGVDLREQTQNVTTGTYVTTSGGQAGTSFGSTNGSSGTTWAGPIAEAIYFNRVLTQQERQKVNSYLAIKYGTTLNNGASSYLDSTGTTVWPVDGTFKNNIAGIGRDATLNQKQSKSTAAGGLVTMGLGTIAATNQDNPSTFTNDRSYLIWGHNGGATDQTTTVTGNYKRMNRIWKTVNTNAVGQVKVQIPKTEVDKVGKDGILYVSTSQTFDQNAQRLDMTLNGANYEATTTFPTGTRYFSFGAFTGSDLEFVSKKAYEGNVEVSSYTPGEPIDYRLVVKNNGPDNAGTVTVTDSLPNGITPSNASGDGWDCEISGQDVTCSRPTLVASSTTPAPTITIEAVAASSATGVKTNSADVSAANDPDTTNNHAEIALTAQAEADLSIVKEDDITGNPIADTEYDYKITVTNNGPSDTPSYTITDTLPAALSYVSATPAICSGSSGQNVTCADQGGLASGQSKTLFVKVHVNTGGEITNTAHVATPASVTDPTADNNESTHNTNAEVKTALSIDKTHTGDVVAGQSASFDITVSNAAAHSDAPVGAVTVTDTINQNFTNIAASGVGWDCEIDQETVRCTNTTVITSGTSSQPITVTADVEPDAIGASSNTATLSTTTPDEGTPHTKTDNFTINSQALLTLTKTASESAFIAGEQAHYTFTVDNAGPSIAHGYQVNDTLPDGATYVGYETDGDMTCSSPNEKDVTCTSGGSIDTADPGQTVTIIVAIDPSAVGTIDNTASVVPTNGTTAVAGDNTGSTGPIPIEPNADLSVTKTHTGDFTAGNNETYTITARNDGPSDVASYELTDTLDPNLNFQSSTPNGACSVTGAAPNGGEVVTCTGGAINSGDTDVIGITVQVEPTATSASTITNTVTIAAPSEVNDPQLNNNTASIDKVVTTSADVRVTKSHTGNFKPGTEGTFTIDVTNDGPSDASTITMTDILPDGLTFVSAEPGCSQTDKTVTCQIGPTLASGQTTTITLKVTVDSDVTASTIANTASVQSSTPDPDQNNNSHTDTVTIDQAEADLVATKTAQGTLTAGEPATYRFEVTNSGGPDAAPEVKITDALPAYMSYQGFENVSGGEWQCGSEGQEITCTLNLLEANDTSIVDVTVMVAQDAPELAENAATVTLNGIDPSPANPASSNPIDHLADLEVAIEREQKTYHSGEQVLYTYVIKNHGPSAAKDVKLTDKIPEGLLIDSISKTEPQGTSLLSTLDHMLFPRAMAADNPFDCSLSGQDLTCNADTLMTGTYTLYVAAHIADGFTGNLTNAVAISSSTPDPNPNNNQATDTIEDVQPADGLAGTGQNILLLVVGATASLAIGIAALLNHRRQKYPT